MTTTRPAVCVYQETKLTLDAAGTVTDISLSHNASSSVLSRDSPKRRRVDRQALFSDESAYTSSYLASESSVYFRRVDDPASPSSILWRVLDNGNVLELQAVDLISQSRDPAPAATTLRFHLPDPISSSGVLLANHQETNKSDSLVVFILTRKTELYRLTLKKEAFLSPSFFDNNGTRSTWLAKCSPSVFSYRKPYRAIVASSTELWISLNDGSLVRLQWSTREDGDKWTETRYNDGNWGGSLLGIIRKSHPTVPYGDITLDSRAAATIAPSPTGQVVWTACLDHTLRAWNVATGKPLMVQDLAGDQDRDLSHILENPLEPHQPALVHISESRKLNTYHLTTYSPVLQAFKFFIVEEHDQEALNIHEEHSDFKFAPPVDDLLEVSGWRLDQYHLIPPKDGRNHHWDLWLLVRCAGRSHVLHIYFAPSAKPSELKHVWESAWSKVSSGNSLTDELKPLVDNLQNLDTQALTAQIPSPSEQWIDFFFSPGHFSPELLETALGIYRRGLERGNQSSALSRRASLKQDICSTVGSALVLQTSENIEENLINYEREIATQWKIYFGVVQDLQKQRERPISLALDDRTSLPWVVAADQAAPVRSCCLLENLWHNRKSFNGFSPTKTSHNPLAEAIQGNSQKKRAGQLLHVLSLFRSALSGPFLRNFRRILLADVLEPGQDTTIERMQNIYNQSGFNGQLGDDDFNRITEALDLFGGFDDLRNEPFEILIQALTSERAEEDSAQSVTPYSLRLLLQGARDTVRLGLEVLQDLALFIVFTAVELEPSDVSQDFFAEDLFELLGPRILEYEMLSFISGTRQHSEADKDVSIIETIAGVLARPPQSVHPETWFLTHWVRTWTFMLTNGSDLAKLGADILAHLLKADNVEQAQESLKFVLDSPWALYVKARFHLASGEPDVASSCFLQSAPELSRTFDANQWDGAGLLSQHERVHFGQGLLGFYQHVVSLFESHGAMSHVIDFALLAIDQTEPGDKETLSARTDVLSRLFTAAIHSLRFHVAFNAMVEYTDSALKRVALQSLVNSLIASSRISVLTTLPFPADLAAEADGHIAALASNPDSLPQQLAKAVAGSASDEPVTITPPHQILYAFRVERNNFRGAAEALWEHVQHLKLSRAQGLRGADVDEEMMESYLGCINALCLVEEPMRWLLVRPVQIPRARNSMGKAVVVEGKINRDQRKLVTLDDVRREWQQYLDYQADLAAGRYALPLVDDNDDEGMDIDGENLFADGRANGAVGLVAGVEDDPFVV